MKYALLTIKHKWFVFRAGLRTRAPIWRLLIHDWTKFLPAELPNYQRQFFGKADDPLGFTRAWIHHQNLNPHHWEYWIPRTGHTRGTRPFYDNVPVPMPEWAIREMVADWLGASRAYEGQWPMPGEWPWFERSFQKIKVHPETHARLVEMLKEMGFTS